METSYLGILSLIPVLLTIGLAIKTKNVILSLGIGVFSGVLLQVGGNPVTATTTMVGDYLFAQLQDGYNAGIIILLVFIGGFVTLIEQSGGAEAFARKVAGLVNNRCKVQVAAWIGGILVFFSELGTPLIVGPVFTPLFEKLRVSKEKLAWIIDTTASPVCILIPFIGWGVYSMGLIQEEFDALKITEITDWTAFISAIPFQFYPILCLLIVPLVAFSGREFSFMAKAEQNAQKGIFSQLDEDASKAPMMLTNNNVSPLVVIIPLLVLFVTLFGILAPLGFPVKQVPGSQFRIALISGYFYGAVTMILMMAWYKVKTIKEGIRIYFKGYGKMFECIVILILAWSLSSVGKAIGTPDFIVNIAKGNIPSWSIPAIIFIVGALISFATGTSWGTFAIMMPIAIPMAFHLGAPLYVSIAAVLSGGLFGDHCSPISDTTILAATGSNCSLLDHVKTQFPYALLCASVSIAGYVVAGFFESVIVTGACMAAMVVVYVLAAKIWGIKIENLALTDIEKMNK
ncbi:Na+/H+ antiporter NhaC family protein [Sinanaerobacter sp. ZZT-01]|uniref:Na+/H+ antiporter NhaC family protein n=1 Tax=Sinanaerobacter sp. ZZT-01 TaxID=3111540 RepID=UPI002D77C0D5|nr:Na+/H+ antiporter NhaC family protein [Sinanaerobacter sp. ZZT-01]WRR95034.1 Na+/H+ antiporter NhaC family protein [Sinanaerobacter sp. ZZT-01]